MDGQTTPDLSNRYLVGFGTEGGGDIDTAAWDAAAVGNASHQVNLQHNHTVDGHTHTTPTHAHSLSAHTHTGPSHSHSIPAHYHGLGTIAIGASGSHSHNVRSKVLGIGSTWTYFIFNDDAITTNTTGITEVATHSHINSDFSGSVGNTGGVDGDAAMTSGDGGSGVTGSPSTDTTDTSGSGTSGSTAPGTDNQLSTSQSIQPRSVRVRFIMRVQEKEKTK